MHGRGVVRGQVALQNFGGRRRRRALHHQNIFNPDGNASQRRQRIAFGRQRVDAPGLLDRPLFSQAQIGIQLRILLFDPRIVAGGQIGGLGAPRGDLLTQAGEALGLLYKGLGTVRFACQWSLSSISYQLSVISCQFPTARLLSAHKADS